MENQLLNKLVFYLLAFLYFSGSSLLTSYGQLLPIVGEGDLQDGVSGPRVYIVHVAEPEDMVLCSPKERENWHKSFLPTVTLDSGEQRLVYSYDVISGFAAWLTPDEVKAMQEMKNGFLYAYPDKPLTLHTTHSPRFLGLPFGLWKTNNLGEGMIIGVIDTGIHPTHDSFRSKRMSPPPSKWNGQCDFVNKSLCNNKLIGARTYDITPRDREPYDNTPHGTLVASIAAGSLVSGARDEDGFASGYALGAAPAAHLAIYKAQRISKLMAAIQDAISDGVDVISISLGSAESEFYYDAIAMGAFKAIKEGIFVSCAGGNSGPREETMRNVAPWMLTVGASTMDRGMSASLSLENGVNLDGESLEPIPRYLHKSSFPLLYIPRTCDKLGADFDIDEKIVACFHNPSTISTFEEAFEFGARAFIIMNNQSEGSKISLYQRVFPTLVISYDDAMKLIEYVDASTSPTVAIIPKSTIYGAQPHPAVWQRSSRGPSLVSNDVLKPDILGPGVDILSASNKGDSTFVIESGTSLATPHLSGIAALLKKSHPTWSPAAIKSAIMTSSDLLDRSGNRIMDETGHPASLFATGAGHVNPQEADDPGLVYDLQSHDYVPYLCGLNYTDDEVFQIIGIPRVRCSTVGQITGEQLNYPSISVTLNSASKMTATKTIRRTVTNVGPTNSVYTSRVDFTPDVYVTVDPHTLVFTGVNQVMSFTVVFTGRNPGLYEGQLWWESPPNTPGSSRHSVRSPMSVSVV